MEMLFIKREGIYSINLKTEKFLIILMQIIGEMDDEK